MKNFIIILIFSLINIVAIAQPRVGYTEEQLFTEFQDPLETDTIGTFPELVRHHYIRDNHDAYYFMLNGVCISTIMVFHDGYSYSLINEICSAGRAKLSEGLYWDGTEGLYYQVHTLDGYVVVRIAPDYLKP